MSNQLSFYMALLRTINIYALDIKVETINGKMQLFTISIENIYVRAFDFEQTAHKMNRYL